MTPATYVLDSSFLIKLHRDQPIELYPTLWVRIADLLSSGEAVVPREAAREIAKKADDLNAWLRATASTLTTSAHRDPRMSRE